MAACLNACEYIFLFDFALTNTIPTCVSSFSQRKPTALKQRRGLCTVNHYGYCGSQLPHSLE